MKTPTQPTNDSTPQSSGRSWSETLKNQTREALEECRINPATQMLHLMNTNGNIGHITVQDLLVRRLNVHCENSGKCWTAEGVENLLEAGWAID